MNTFVVLLALVAAAVASNEHYGYGTAGYHGLGHHAGYQAHGHYGYARGGPVRYFNDRSGNTVPTMGEDQNNDGVADKHDSNRDGKEDKPKFAYGYGYGYGYGHPGYGYGHPHGYGYPAYGVNGYVVAKAKH